MAVQYAPTKLRVPPGFQNLLEGLSREVLREQPSNIIQFAANYFKDQLLIRNETGKDDTKKGSDMEKLQNEEEVDIDLNDPSTADAAVKIQAVFRGHKSRRKQEESKQKKDQEEAATRIQAGFRGHQARKSVKEMKSSESELNEEQNDIDDAGDEDGGGGEYVESVTKNEETEKPKDDEEKIFDDPKYEEAATKIQAGFRGHKVREEMGKRLSKMNLDQNDVENMNEEQENEGNVKEFDGEEADEKAKEEEAAIKIQASFRGHVARKDVAAIKSNQDISDDTKVENDESEKNEEEAAIKIQAGFRGYVARKEINAMKSSQNENEGEENAAEDSAVTAEQPEEPSVDDEDQMKAATKIQASYRGYRTRANLKPDNPPESNSNDNDATEESDAKESEAVEEEGGNEET